MLLLTTATEIYSISSWSMQWQTEGLQVNKEKSLAFLGKYAQPKKCSILGILSRPLRSFFQDIANKVRCKLSAWKSHMLSQVGHQQLISSVIWSLLIYSFQVYAWPRLH
ncbi:unnamed protein product [Malus baccata var. baccata]